MAILNIFRKKKTPTISPLYKLSDTQRATENKALQSNISSGNITDLGSLDASPATTSRINRSYGGGGGGSGGSSGGSSGQLTEKEAVIEGAYSSSPEVVARITKDTKPDKKGLQVYEGKIGDRITEKGNVLFISKDEEARVKGTPSEPFTYTVQARGLAEATTEADIVGMGYTGITRGFIPTETEIKVASERKGDVVGFAGSVLDFEREKTANIVAFRNDPEFFAGKQGVDIVDIDGGKQYTLTPSYFENLGSYKNVKTYFDDSGKFISGKNAPIGFNPKPINTISGIATGVEKGGIGIVEFGGTLAKELITGPTGGSFNPDNKIFLSQPTLTGKYVAGINSKPTGFAEGFGIGVTLLPAASSVLSEGYKIIKSGTLLRTITNPITSLKAADITIGGALERGAEARYLQRFGSVVGDEKNIGLVSKGKFVNLGVSVKQDEFAYGITATAAKGTTKGGTVITDLTGSTATGIRNPLTGKINVYTDNFKSAAPIVIKPSQLSGVKGSLLTYDKGSISPLSSSGILKFDKAGYQDIAFGSLGLSPKSKGGVTATRSLGLTPFGKATPEFSLAYDLEKGANSLNKIQVVSKLRPATRSKGLVFDVDYYLRPQQSGTLGLTKFKGGGTKTPFSKTFGIQETKLDLGGLTSAIGGKTISKSAFKPPKLAPLGSGGATSLVNIQKNPLKEISSPVFAPQITRTKEFPKLAPLVDTGIKSPQSERDKGRFSFAPKLDIGISQTPAFKPAQLEGFKFKTNQKMEQVPKFRTDFNVPSVTIPFRPPTYKGFLFPPINFGGFDLPRTGTRSKVGKRKFKRTPSLAAAELGITSSKPFRFEEAGIGLRPVLTPKRRKRKKR